MDKNEIYASELDSLRRTSYILRPPSRNNTNSDHVLLGHKQGLETLIRERKSTQEGLESELEGIQADFDRRKKQASQEGRKPSESLPADLVQKEAEIQARIDVLKEEVGFLESKLNVFLGQEEKEAQARLQKIKPIGSGSLRNGQLCEIDGQRVSFRGGRAFIDEPASKYHGMPVEDYREKIVKPFLQARSEKFRLAEQKKAKLTEDYNKELQALQA